MEQKYILEPSIESILGKFAKDELLPDAFNNLARQWYWPLSRELINSIKKGKIRVLGVSGSQGSGKSTLASLLCRLFGEVDELKVVGLSLDDFYLTYADRQTLAKEVHPLFQTRGVPGTHDVQLAIEIINNLLQPKSVKIPRFDKAKDDRKAIQDWDVIEGPVDLVILEGWCLSLSAEDANELSIPLNTLEKQQDSDGLWRNYVNHSLAETYPPLFNLVDFLIYLKAPHFDAVKNWRGNQEQKLANKVTDTNNKVMDQEKLDFFMQHYQRLTSHGFKCLPKIANVTFLLNEAQQITERSNN